MNNKIILPLKNNNRYFYINENMLKEKEEELEEFILKSGKMDTLSFAKKVLLLISDTPSTCSDIRNRKDVMLFGDSAVGIIVEYTEQETPSYFYTGACGKSWESIVKPAGGAKIPIKKDIIDLELINKDGVPFEVVNPRPSKELLKALQEGEDILNGKVKAKSYTNMYEMLKDLKA